MIQVQEQTDEEKRVMYNKLSKKELIEMLIASNKIVDRLLPQPQYDLLPNYVPPVYVPNDWPITTPVFVNT